jgi:adenine phosphoribosyltransferase
VSTDLLAHIQDIPDFPKPGIVFKDITPLLASPDGLSAAIEAIAAPYMDANVDLVIGVEARGFLFSTPVAYCLGAGCVPFRKPGKLPYETVEHNYELQYGTDTLEAHTDAISAGARVVIVDDVLATGGTAAAAVELVGNLGGDIVGCAFLMELGFLRGRERLRGQTVSSVLRIE